MASERFHKYNSVETDINDIDLQQYNPSLLTPTSKQICEQWKMDKYDELLINGYFRTCDIAAHHLPSDILRTIASFYTKAHSKGSLKRKMEKLQKIRDRKIRERKQWMKSRFKSCLKILALIILCCFVFGADISALVIIDKYDCDAILNSNTKLSNIGINRFLSIGSITHIVIVPVLLTLIAIARIKYNTFHNSWYYFTTQQKCVTLICIVSFISVTLFFVSWGIIGSILYSNIIQPNPYQPCSDILISWIVLKFILYIVFAPTIFSISIGTDNLFWYPITWMIAVFAMCCGADIAGLIIVANNECDLSIANASDFISFGVDVFLLYGCSVHIGIEVLFLCSLFMVVLFGDSSNFIGYHDNHIVKTAVCFAVLFGLLSLSWSAVGCFLYSEMDKSSTTLNKRCADVTIAWIVTRFIEFVLVQPLNLQMWTWFFLYLACYTS